jgi:hypothetical protein
MPAIGLATGAAFCISRLCPFHVVFPGSNANPVHAYAVAGMRCVVLGLVSKDPISATKMKGENNVAARNGANTYTLFGGEKSQADKASMLYEL